MLYDTLYNLREYIEGIFCPRRTKFRTYMEVCVPHMIALQDELISTINSRKNKFTDVSNHAIRKMIFLQLEWGIDITYEEAADWMFSEWYACEYGYNKYTNPKAVHGQKKVDEFLTTMNYVIAMIANKGSPEKIESIFEKCGGFECIH